MASKNWVRAITATAAVGLLIPVCATGQGRGATTYTANYGRRQHYRLHARDYHAVPGAHYDAH